jgi:hypothetical protein
MVKVSFSTLFLVSIAVISGAIVLLGYFLPLPGLTEVRLQLMDWAMILAAVAALVGGINLFRVHWQRLRSTQSGAGYSAVLLLSLALTVAILAATGPAAALPAWIYNYVLVPIETSLLAILAVTLIIAFARLIGRRFNLFGLIFAGTVLFILISAIAWLPLTLFGLPDLRNWLVGVWSLAGARGILLGVALGVIATGLRVLTGSDRPYNR